MFGNSWQYRHMIWSRFNPAGQRKTQGFVVFWRVCSAWKCPASCSPLYRETSLRFKTGAVTPSAVFTTFGAQWFSPFLVPARRSTWTSLQVGWGCKADGAFPADTATKTLLLPRNLCLSGTKGEACRTWLGRHWNLISFYNCIWFFIKSLYIIFLVFIWMALV